MVIEFTNLQGEVGREYALVDGKTKEIAEHWRPRFAGDEPASRDDRAGSRLADKLDTIVGY